MADEIIPQPPKKYSQFSLAEYQKLLEYQPDTGEFFWKHRPDAIHSWNTQNAGRKTGFHDRHGHIHIGVTFGRVKVRVSAHRLAWFMMTGTWPRQDVDHINGNRADNRFANLREASRQENLRNMKRRSSNTSGYKGVSWSKIMKKWKAQIRNGITNMVIGYFDSPEQAHEAWKVAAIKVHGKFARFE